jgi:hypothetical protein
MLWTICWIFSNIFLRDDFYCCFEICILLTAVLCKNEDHLMKPFGGIVWLKCMVSRGYQVKQCLKEKVYSPVKPTKFRIKMFVLRVSLSKGEEDVTVVPPNIRSSVGLHISHGSIWQKCLLHIILQKWYLIRCFFSVVISCLLHVRVQRKRKKMHYCTNNIENYW